MDLQRESILSHFVSTYPDIEGEMQRQKFQWEQLSQGFKLGDLTYDTYLCRMPNRMV